MGEVLLMKSLKGIIGAFCYFGTGIIAIDKVLDGAIKEVVDLHPGAQHIILYLLIIFWMVKIAWFAYDKFHLERKERNLKMDQTRGEIERTYGEIEKGRVTNP